MTRAPPLVRPKTIRWFGSPAVFIGSFGSAAQRQHLQALGTARDGRGQLHEGARLAPGGVAARPVAPGPPSPSGRSGGSRCGAWQ